MEQDILVSRLSELLQDVQSNQEQTKMEFEKLQIALTGVLKLFTAAEDSPLTRMQGTPRDLKGYIIRLVSELHISTINQWEILNVKLKQILQAVRNS